MDYDCFGDMVVFTPLKMDYIIVSLGSVFKVFENMGNQQPNDK